MEVVEDRRIGDDEAVRDAFMLLRPMREMHVPAFEQADRNFLIGQDADVRMARIVADPVP